MKQKILNILSNNLEFNLTEFNQTIEKKNFQNWDSIKTLMIITDIEQEFNISFSPEEIEQIESFDSIYSLLTNKVSPNE